MTRNELSLQPYVTDLDVVPTLTREKWERFLFEASVALERIDGDLLKQWAVGSAGIAIDTVAKRSYQFFDLLRAVASGAWTEFKKMWNALWSGTITDYVRDLCRRVWEKLRAIWSAIKEGFNKTKDFVASLRDGNREQLVEVASGLAGAVVGFIVMGGTGNGGMIDADIRVLGIGRHRSIWFHSVFIGLAAEVTFKSFFELQRLLHSNLPTDHLPIWDRMLRISDRFHKGLVSGSWLGVTTHLAVDSHIDGWTPYKDLPVALPNWGHHMIMDLNAAASGWFAWQWHDKVGRRLRDNRIRPAAQLVDRQRLALPQVTGEAS